MAKTWTLIYRDESDQRELRSAAMESRVVALRLAHIMRAEFTVIRIEGHDKTLDAAEIDRELASGKYLPPGMSMPDP
jgi:hypothetical protein